MSNLVHVSMIVGLLRRGRKDIDKALELMETKILVGHINQPLSQVERKQRVKKKKTNIPGLGAGDGG